MVVQKLFKSFLVFQEVVVFIRTIVLSKCNWQIFFFSKHSNFNILALLWSCKALSGFLAYMEHRNLYFSPDFYIYFFLLFFFFNSYILECQKSSKWIGFSRQMPLSFQSTRIISLRAVFLNGLSSKVWDIRCIFKV